MATLAGKRAGRHLKGSTIMAVRTRTRPATYSYIIGIDEAGRGPLAGPVVVAGIRVDSRFRINDLGIDKIRDSKKLSAKQRDKWFRVLTDHPRIEWAVARVYPAMIDRINIARATHLGAWRVYRKLARDVRVPALLDGSLKLPAGVPHRTIIRGDETVPVISAASIIAKVTRDRIMARLHRRYPQYRFDIHKGYGTRLHFERITQCGLSDIHRRTFCTWYRAGR